MGFFIAHFYVTILIMEMEFVIQGKPVAKQSTKFCRNGFAYTPAHIKEYSNWVRLCFMQNFAGFEPLTVPLAIEIHAFFEVPKSFSKKKTQQALNCEIFPTVKPDCDNISKNILDSLNKIAYLDDRQVVCLVVKKMYAEKAFVKVKIKY